LKKIESELADSAKLSRCYRSRLSDPQQAGQHSSYDKTLEKQRSLIAGHLFFWEVTFCFMFELAQIQDQLAISFTEP